MFGRRGTDRVPREAIAAARSFLLMEDIERNARLIHRHIHPPNVTPSNRRVPFPLIILALLCDWKKRIQQPVGTIYGRKEKKKRARKGGAAAAANERQR
mmetsp:Transcript_26461/g.36881  ORF Transcript_26461/g.36881 Transcript_26461/m.36881 type:complete len:99 (-) Transcript_26461:24-320(-)